MNTNWWRMKKCACERWVSSLKLKEINKKISENWMKWKYNIIKTTGHSECCIYLFWMFWCVHIINKVYNSSEYGRITIYLGNTHNKNREPWSCVGNGSCEQNSDNHPRKWTCLLFVLFCSQYLRPWPNGLVLKRLLAKWIHPAPPSSV